MTQSENKTCQCVDKNCVDCKCGCSGGCCSGKATSKECPFLKSHPNWQKCPFMSNIFAPKLTNTEANIAVDHSSCDEAKCANIPMTQCTSCHKTPGFTHTITLAMDTDVAADQSEETVL